MTRAPQNLQGVSACQGDSRNLLAKKRERQEKAGIDHVAERETWTRLVSDLMTRIHGWLRPLEERGYLRTYRRERVIREDLLGDYAIGGLHIEFVDGQSIDIQPIGRFIIGGEGRVDLQAGARTIMIVHTGQGKWQFAERTGRHGPPRPGRSIRRHLRIFWRRSSRRSDAGVLVRGPARRLLLHNPLLNA